MDDDFLVTSYSSASHRHAVLADDGRTGILYLHAPSDDAERTAAVEATCFAFNRADPIDVGDVQKYRPGARACLLLQTLMFAIPNSIISTAESKGSDAPATSEALLSHYMTLTEKVCDNARRRVLQGETLSNEEKIFSIFEPHMELIKRGKQPNPVQFGHSVMLIEDAVGFVVDYRVVEAGVLDQDLVVPVMKKLQGRFKGKIKSASFDRGFHTPENQQKLGEIVGTPCIATKGQEKGRRQQKEGTVAFRRARQSHPGVESVIGALQSGNGLKRCRDRSRQGFARYIGLGVLGRNLQTLGKLLLAQDMKDCQAAKSKRKRKAG